jgi:hypothetical protein
VLTGGGVAAAAVICGVGTMLTGAALLEGTTRYLRAHDGDIEAAGDDGRTFAVGHTVTECVDEAHRRRAGCGSLALDCVMPVGIFAGTCVRAANEDGYCALVPASSEHIATAQWKQAACASSSGLACEPMMAVVQTACEHRKEDAIADDGAGGEPREPG